jgi:hypothetical protein
MATLITHPVSNDFEGNGTSDILVADATGDYFVCPILNATLNGPPIYTGTTPFDWFDWQFLATGDFNGDRTTDIAFSDPHGNLYDWIIRGATQFGAPNLLLPQTSSLHFVAVGDFNGDATSDLAVSDAFGNLYDLTVKNGTTTGAASYMGSIAPGGFWRFLTTGDFNGDGTSDIAVSDALGNIYEWPIKNGSPNGAPAYVGTTTTGWKFLATGDFNGDGATDFLVGNTRGNLFDWIIQNGSISSVNSIATVTNGWSFLETGDFNGDGTTDIAVTDAAGHVYDLPVRNGCSAERRAIWSPPPTAGTRWPRTPERCFHPRTARGSRYPDSSPPPARRRTARRGGRARRGNIPRRAARHTEQSIRRSPGSAPAPVPRRQTRHGPARARATGAARRRRTRRPAPPPALSRHRR